MDRQARIDAEIDACTECRGGAFPKRADCDGCTAAVDDEIAAEAEAAIDTPAEDPFSDGRGGDWEFA